MSPSRTALAAAAVALTLSLPAGVQAQEATPKNQVLSINPLVLIFGGVSGEFERRVGTGTSVAAGLSYYTFDDADYLSVEGKYRFYPSGEALRGFSVAGTGGYTHVGDDDACDDSFFDDCTDSGNALTVGVELNYQWLLGRERNFAVTLGGGAKRLFFLGDEVTDASIGVPTLRLSIGYAF